MRYILYIGADGKAESSQRVRDSSSLLVMRLVMGLTMMLVMMMMITYHRQPVGLVGWLVYWLDPKLVLGSAGLGCHHLCIYLGVLSSFDGGIG